MSTFLELVDRAQALLAERGRVSLRALGRELSLDDESLEDLAEELVDVQQVATRDGKVLVWSGAAATPARTSVGVPSVPTAPTGLGGERRQLTVMFCDLVGSTSLAERMDPEELRDVMRGYRTTCVEATERFGGHVGQYLGDGVLVFFGYPEAREDAAECSIRAGLEIQRVLTEIADDRIQARIGIHTGLVVVDGPGADGSGVLGSTTNVAARIEGMAQPGTVVVSEATLSLCRGIFVARSLGETALKGLEETVLLHEIERSLGVRGTVATALAKAKPMVGRDREVGLLLDRWEDVQEGRGQVLLISGDPGMGKSRLVQALREELGDSDHAWLDMQCSPFTSGSAFQPLVDLFTTGLAAGRAETPEKAAQLLVSGLESMPGLAREKVIPYLLGLLSLPASERYPVPQTSAKEQRERTMAALLELNLTMTAMQPVVLVAEDLQWADPSTLEYLGRMIEQAATSRVLLVLTFRSEFHALWKQSHVAEVKLTRLSKRVTREMITNAVGGHLPELVLAQLEARSDGVPLFVEELAQGVVSSGVMTEAAGRYELRGSVKDLAIPATLQDSLMARLDRLSASKQVAQQAATLGREFPYELIAAVTELETPALRTALGQLVAAEIVHQRGMPPEATYTFKHALLQDAAYESQLLSTRRALHGKIAAVLEARFPERVAAEPETMARHCAAAGESAKAVDYYQRAGELAVSRLANEEAAEHFRRALDALDRLPDDGERRQREIAIRLAEGESLVALRGYEAPAVTATYARVEELCHALGEGPEQLGALIGLVKYDMARGDLIRGRDRAEALMRIAEPLGIPELLVVGHFLIGSASIVTMSSVEGTARIGEALAIAETVKFPEPATPYDLDLLSLAYAIHGHALVDCAKPEQAMAAMRASRARSSQIDHQYSRAVSVASMTIPGFLLDDAELTRSVAEEALALSAGRGFHSADVMATILRGWARACHGEIDAGVHDVEDGLALAESSGSVAGLPLLQVVAAHVHRMAGNRPRAEALLDLASAAGERTGEVGYRHPILHARALLCLEAGKEHLARAENLLLKAVEVAGKLEVLMWELVYSTQLARLAPRTGKVGEARERLATHYARLTEGFDRPPMRAAKAALDELAAMSDTQAAAS